MWGCVSVLTDPLVRGGEYPYSITWRDMSDLSTWDCSNLEGLSFDIIYLIRKVYHLIGRTIAWSDWRYHLPLNVPTLRRDRQGTESWLKDTQEKIENKLMNHFIERDIWSVHTPMINNIAGTYIYLGLWNNCAPVMVLMNTRHSY